MALVVLSVVEQRLDAVRAVLAGAEVVEVASAVGVHRSTVHRWVARYLSEQIAGLADRSHRPFGCPHQAVETVEVAVAEMRREHPRWGSRRIRLELLRKPLPWQDEDIAVPSERTIDRILVRHGLPRQRPRTRARESYQRFQRPGPMQLWGIDIVGGVRLVNTATGEVREAKIVTGDDDHSRFSRYGPQRGEVLFDKICRKNGITHRLIQPSSPNQNGKVERFHGTFRPDFLDDYEPFTSVQQAQAAVDAWVLEYNTDRPHQGLDEQVPVVPADRFTPAADNTVELWLPPSVAPAPTPEPEPQVVSDGIRTRHSPASQSASVSARKPGSATPLELDLVVPSSGNMALCGQQFWLGPARAGQVVRFWIDYEWVHLSIGGQRIKSLHSRFSELDLDTIAARGAVPTGPPPVASRGGPGSRASRTVFEIERTVAKNGMVSLGARTVLAAWMLAGRRVGIYIEEGAPLLFFDPATRELLRTRPNRSRPGRPRRCSAVDRPGPVPRPSTEPLTVQRRASHSGVITVAGQKVALGRQFKHHTVTVHVSETTLAIELPGADTMVVRRTTEKAVRSIKGQRPRTAGTSVS